MSLRLPTTVPAPGPSPAPAGGGPAGGSHIDRRTRTLLGLAGALALVAAVVVAGTWAEGPAATTDLAQRHRAPAPGHLFGTDAYGRDLLLRTLVGLRLSLLVGCLAAVMSGVIAALLALVAVAGGRVGTAVVDWLVDLFLALPHLVLLILLAFALGGGTSAVVLAVGLTHWPRLTRVLTSVARESFVSDHVAISRALGHGRVHVARRHLAPVLVPHLSVGMILMFPHAILHEAALSFLGLGVDPGKPAIGILLSDAMRTLSAGHWWLAVLPGVALLVVVRVVDRLGENLRLLTDPRSAHL